MMQNALLSSLIWQLLLTFAFAAPIVDTTNVDNTLGYGTGGGIIGLIVLILDIIVFSTFLQSCQGVSPETLQFC